MTDLYITDLYIVGVILFSIFVSIMRLANALAIVVDGGLQFSLAGISRPRAG